MACRNCKWWNKDKEFDSSGDLVSECSWAIAHLPFVVVLHSAYFNLVTENQGDDCPCFEPIKKDDGGCE